MTTDRRLLGASALLFAASAIVTVVWCNAMSMGGMDMPGGWTMSMTWMRMPGQTWPGAAATFLGMWTVMMVAMMLPSLVPMLARYRRAVGNSRRLGRLTLLAGAAYFAVWTLVGVAAYPLGVAIARVAMQAPWLARVAPIAAGTVVVAAGALQFTAWKTRQLACCRNESIPALPADARSAWRHGLRLGVRCVKCCLGLTVLLLVVGVMDVRVMGLVTVAISAERLAPVGARVARVVGGLVMASGLALMY